MYVAVELKMEYQACQMFVRGLHWQVPGYRNQSPLEVNRLVISAFPADSEAKFIRQLPSLQVVYHVSFVPVSKW